jgi:hypothetical protein
MRVCNKRVLRLLSEIKQVMKRSREPENPGDYHVYRVWCEPPEHVAVIRVVRGARGGRRPLFYMGRNKRFYWSHMYIWITAREYDAMHFTLGDK